MVTLQGNKPLTLQSRGQSAVQWAPSRAFIPSRLLHFQTHCDQIIKLKVAQNFLKIAQNIANSVFT